MIKVLTAPREWISILPGFLVLQAPLDGCKPYDPTIAGNREFETIKFINI